LNVDLGASQTGKNEGLLRKQKMGTIELGGDMHRKIEVPHRLECDVRIGHRDSEIATETDQSLRTPIPDRLDGFDRIVALVAWRFESEYPCYSIQEIIVRNLGNADRAVTLHIRMAAQRRNAGAPAPDITSEQQQIGDL